jgi:translocator protein
MDYYALGIAVGICLLSVVFEALGTSKAGKKWFEDLRQPKLSFPFWVWYIIGGLYYVICGIVAYRVYLRKEHPNFQQALTLLILMMFINGFTNFILFKWRSIRAFYFSIYPFSIITIWLFIVLLKVDAISAWVLFPYIVWLLYDIYYFHFLWKLNNSNIMRV